jgi:carboxylesterase
MTAPVLVGAEPFSASGGPDGVLLLHGFTGSPKSLRSIAEVLANRGYTVELPLLPGHGTALADLLPMRWGDWTKAAEAAFDDLVARCARVAVVGLSMGGGLSVWLAEHRPEVHALVVVNPLLSPIDAELREGARQLLDQGTDTIDGVANDICKQPHDEVGYSGLPIAAAMSLMDGLEEVARDLGNVTCPLLVLTSRQDHVVATENSTRLVEAAKGPTEHLWLERSYHVATLDFDAELIEAEASRFLEAAFDAA